MVPCHRRIFNGLHKQHKNSFPCYPFSPHNIEISYYYRIVIHTGPSPVSILTFLKLAPGQKHFAFTAYYIGARASVARGGKEAPSTPDRISENDGGSSSFDFFIFMEPGTRTIALFASRLTTLGELRAVKRAEQNEVPSTPGRLGERYA